MLHRASNVEYLDEERHRLQQDDADRNALHEPHDVYELDDGPHKSRRLEPYAVHAESGIFRTLGQRLD